MLSANRNYEMPRTVGFGVAVAIAVVVSRALPLGRGVGLFALAAIGVAVWHGAFDNALAAEVLAPRLGARWAVMFFPAYVALALGCVALWWVLPAVMLPLFLLYSAWHFGMESEAERGAGAVVRGVARGVLPIVAACHWWPGAVAEIFAQMLRGHGAWGAQLTSGAGALLWPCVVVLAGAVLLGWRADSVAALLWMPAELCLFRWCGPLVAFAVYFCLWHTPDHLLSTSLDGRGDFAIERMWRHLRAGLWPWLVALTGVGVLGWVGRHALESYAGAVFIGLSALTVPHMALAELMRSLEKDERVGVSVANRRERVLV